jgi:hypothetical protein
MAAITPHFSLEELTVTQQTGPDGKILPNVPNATQLKYLTKLATLALEPIRMMWACPVKVNSAFRCEAVEIKVSGKAYGQHMLGQAADIVPMGSLPLKRAYELIWKSKIPYDQLLLENVSSSVWIHISVAPDDRTPRRQALMTPNAKNWFAYDPVRVSDLGRVL